MGHLVALNFEDGVTRFVDCGAQEKVADASYRAGINIPLDCRDGACGTCRTLCEAGSFDGGDYIEDALSAAEAAEGFGLACQMRPRSDLVLRIAASSLACKTRPAVHEGVIGAIETLSETTIRFTVSSRVAFLPGQYVNVAVPGSGQARSYSFSSAPGADAAEFLVRVIPGGLMTTFLQGAAAGTAVSFTGPVGGFYLRPVVRPVLMLAGGTGLAPFLSMLDQLVTVGCAQPVHLVYGVTRPGDLVAVARLERVAAALPGFSFVTVVADAGSGHARTGFVTGHMDGAPAGADVYLCGPPAMVDAVRPHVAGAPSFHYEKFAPSGAA